MMTFNRFALILALLLVGTSAALGVRQFSGESSQAPAAAMATSTTKTPTEQPTETAIPDGCDQLISYYEDLRDISEDVFGDQDTWDEQNEDDTEVSFDDIASAPPDGLRKVATIIDAYAEGLRSVDPPDAVADWHDTRIKYAQMVANAMRAMAADGPFAIMAFDFDTINQEHMVAQTTAIGECSTFVADIGQNDFFGDMVEYD